MEKPKIPENEKERLEALYSYDLLDEVEQVEFNEIVNLAASICETPISLITLIDSSVQWHKAKVGDIAKFIQREISFCGHAINQPNEILIVDDATQDERFADNPLVTGAPFISFYAGIPLVTGDGFSLGALCVIDQKPRKLEEAQLTALRTLSHQIIRLFELRKTVIELEQKEILLEQTVKNLYEYTAVVAHDLKVPFRNIEIASEVLRKKNQAHFDEECHKFIDSIQRETTESKQFINDILKYSKSIHSYNSDKLLIDMNVLMPKILEKLKPPAQYNIIIEKNLPILYHSPIAVQHIFENLIENSIKYTDHLNPEIIIRYEQVEDSHIFEIEDNGRGIPKELHSTIFELFQQANQDESRAVKSVGVGLTIVSKLVNLMAGKIEVDSEVGKGTKFILEFPKSTNL